MILALDIFDVQIDLMHVNMIKGSIHRLLRYLQNDRRKIADNLIIIFGAVRQRIIKTKKAILTTIFRQYHEGHGQTRCTFNPL